ncbi:Panacea domain-containing protein [Sinorhizobium fredii]|uniref:Panacea domain-containing protein n=1 Tax=Rhizobium fredii TaxID=380 RepID=UPI003391CCA8
MAAIDVATYVLEQKGEMSAMKLQKLVYYSQAWSLVWDERPLFDESIEAWANGPVCPALYARHRGDFLVTAGTFGGNSAVLDGTAKETIDRVLEFYGDKPAQWLSELTHIERPWLDARDGVPVGARCNNVIGHAAMAEYYASL